ncbi:Endonuclease/exonuclease/phosphatase superfamily [Sesbania bispinosa]|nr:Endonuclease/exonuclease/phosphatase superfamily [Sesbania bispinosa]
MGVGAQVREAPAAEAVTGSGDKGVANHANPSGKLGDNNGQIIGKEDIHGDWLTKNRGSNDEGEKNPRQQFIGIASKNKFHAISGGNDEVVIAQDKGTKTVPKQDFTFNSEGPKLLVRKKRPRKEPIFFEPKIFKYDKPTSNSSQVQPPPKPCNVTDAGSQARETQVDDVSVAPKVYTHPHEYGRGQQGLYPGRGGYGDARGHVLAWNVRGAASRKSQRHLRDLLGRTKPSFVFLFETHTPFQNTTSFWTRSGYQMVAVEDANGHSGGIWGLVQEGLDVTLQVLHSGPQAISILVTKTSTSWILTGVYASPNPALRRLLWEDLVQLRGAFNLPWLLIGDFNDILWCSEQGGSDQCISSLSFPQYAGPL